MISVCLVEDQTLVREGIRNLLHLVPDVTVVAEARDGEEALALIPTVGADVVLLDLNLPKRSGIEVMRELRAADMLPPTLVLTTFDDDELALEAVRAGARGFLLKDVSLEDLAVAIRTLSEGGTLIRPALTERILRALQSRAKPVNPIFPRFGLTDREQEVVRMLASGFSNREIAEAFGMAEGTVKNHVSMVLSKLGVRDRTRAVLKAIEQGLL